MIIGETNALGIALDVVFLLGPIVLIGLLAFRGRNGVEPGYRPPPRAEDREPPK